MTSATNWDAASSDAPGRFGPYRVIRPIGSGGMATVFEAEEERLGQRVAVKVLHEHLVARTGAAERFLREGRAVARIRHPHVVQVLAVGPDTEAPYLAMELLDGEDLAARLERTGRLSVSAALDVLLPTLAGIAAAHDAGVIHRDLKPSNIFLSRLGGRQWPKVVDFGISKVVAADELTASDALLGTVAYMAPEHARSVRGASFASDQYSMALVLYQCVIGALPFSGSGPFELMQAIMTAPVVPPSQRVPGVPVALDAVVLRALDRDPARRFPSVRAFACALLPFASESAQHAWRGEFGPHACSDDRPATDHTSVSPLGFTLQTGKVTQEGRPRRRFLLLAPIALLPIVAGFLGVVHPTRVTSPARADDPAASQPSPTVVAASVANAALLEVEPPPAPPPTAPTSQEPEAAKAAPRSPSVRTGGSRVRSPSLPGAASGSDDEACRKSPEGCAQLGHNDAPILP
jgi:serine/threonine-protein kinase